MPPKKYIAYVIGEKEDYEEEGDEEEDEDEEGEDEGEEEEGDEEEDEGERDVEPYEEEEEEDEEGEEEAPPPKPKRVEFKVVKEEEWKPVEVVRRTTPYASWYEVAALITSRAVQLTSPGNLPLIDPEGTYASESIAKREIQNMIRKLASGAENPKEWTVMLGIERKLLDGHVDFYRADELIYPRGFLEDP